MPCPPPGDLPDPGIEPASPTCRQIRYHLSQDWLRICYICTWASQPDPSTKLKIFLYPRKQINITLKKKIRREGRKGGWKGETKQKLRDKKQDSDSFFYQRIKQLQVLVNSLTEKLNRNLFSTPAVAPNWSSISSTYLA